MRLLRRTLTPGEHDALALQVANRRIVELETAHAMAMMRLTRMADRHRRGCAHAQELAEARLERDIARQEQRSLYRRCLGILDQLRELNGTTPAKALMPPREPR